MMSNNTQHPTTDKLREQLDQQRDSLEQIAQKMLDDFWQNHMLNKPSAAHPSALGCRMRQKGDSIYLEWYHNRWRKKTGGGFQPLSCHISKPGRNFLYSLNKLFAHAPEWEHPTIRHTEAVFANLRRQNHQLTQIRRNIRTLDQLLTELDTLMATDIPAD